MTAIFIAVTLVALVILIPAATILLALLGRGRGRSL